MNTMKWMLRREVWEHKGSLFWAPVVVAAILLVFTAGSVGWALFAHDVHFEAVVGGARIQSSMLLSEMPSQARAEMVHIASGSYVAAALPLFVMMAFVLFFYCLSALYDERRDRSVLFWKSLPLSDSMTVLSKVATALLVAPLITIAAATAMSLALLLILTLVLASHGVNVLGALLSTPSLYLSPLQVVGMLPVYMLWALPTVGWLLMVSSWAKSKPFLWAVGVPVIALVIVKWVDVLLGATSAGAQAVQGGSTLAWFAREIVGRVLTGVMPGMWFSFSPPSPAMHPGEQGLDMGTVFTGSWETLAAPGVWIGALAGIAMIVVAIRMRRWRDEG